MPHRIIDCRGRRELNRGVTNSREILLRDLPAGFCPGRQFWKERVAKNGGVHFIEPAVETEPGMHVMRRLPVVSHFARGLGNRRVVSQKRARVA